ncbi:MAG TPA: hypothetical protein VLH56_03220 [Dissulfurispiraceae bacterium]|nr:hypothetical protein [Dissulfurispiraceae bacterium]
MGIYAGGQNDEPILPEFQRYLEENSLVPANRVSFYAYWVERYQRYAKKHSIDASGYHEQSILSFLVDSRADERIKDLLLKK